MEAQRVAHGRQRAEPEPRGLRGAGWLSDLDGASPATKHYVERTLLGYRLAGVDKDQATRDRLQSLHEKATRLSLEFSRNIQEGGKTIEAAAAELDGLPADYIARHPADARRPRDAHHRPARHAAGDDLCRERRVCASACSWPTTPAPIRPTSRFLLDLLATRQEIATVLGFRSWADLATADQMMGSAANVRTFLAKLNEASRDGARARASS